MYTYFVFRKNIIRKDTNSKYKLNDDFIHDVILFTVLLIYIYINIILFFKLKLTLHKKYVLFFIHVQSLELKTLYSYYNLHIFGEKKYSRIIEQIMINYSYYGSLLHIYNLYLYKLRFFFMFIALK